MKEYKLIKEYSGSPKLGTIVNCSEKHKIYNYDSEDYFIGLPKHQVKNLPEYWEEVVKKDYQIIKLISKSGDISDLINNSGEIAWSIDDDINYMMPEDIINLNEGHEIYCVKRLSDGMVFSIGDRVQYKTMNIWNDTSTSTILKMSLYHDKIIISTNIAVDWAFLSDSIRIVPKSDWIKYSTDDIIKVLKFTHRKINGQIYDDYIYHEMIKKALEHGK